ncbi:NAD(P)/FAD-dependent oxidoreductase [Cutibacterium acnes]
MPTKDLIDSASKRDGRDPASYFTSAVADRDTLIATLNRTNHAMLEGKVLLLDGVASFTGPHTVKVVAGDDEITVRAETIIVNTGSHPANLPVPGADGPRVHDSTTIQHVDPLPSQLVIVGGGFIGLEFAQMFARFGSQVTLLEAGETFVPALDTDIAERVRNMLEGEGVTVVTGAQVTSCDETGDHVDVVTGAQVTSCDETGDHVDVVTDDQTFAADAVLVAAGRRPATEDLDLTAAGVATDERGYITVDDQLRTNIDGVYAVGDVNGGPQFTYISLDDNRVLWDTLHDGPRRRDDRVAVPATTFLDPPLSQVGMTMRQARESGRSVLVATKDVATIAAMPRPKIVGQTEGVIRVLVDADDHTVLGATLWCIDSQELVNFVSLAMRLGVRYETLRDGIWTHPSSTEAFNEVLGVLEPLT